LLQCGEQLGVNLLHINSMVIVDGGNRDSPEP